MQFSFRKTSFLKTQNFAKTLFWHTVTLFVLPKKPKNTIKLGKNSKKNLDQFLTYNLDQFLTYKTPNLGPVFNFTAYIYIMPPPKKNDIYIYVVVFNFWVFFLRVQKCSLFFASWCNRFQTKKPVLPRWNLFIRTKLALENQTCGLSSNAFKNGALMLRNIGTPFSNSRHPIFERINFPCFRPRLLFPSQPRNPYFCSVFHVKQPFCEDPPKSVQLYNFESGKYNKKSKIAKLREASKLLLGDLSQGGKHKQYKLLALPLGESLSLRYLHEAVQKLFLCKLPFAKQSCAV